MIHPFLSARPLRDEAERSGDLEQAAELSRIPNVHLDPGAASDDPGRGAWGR